MQIGIDSFAATGPGTSPKERLSNLLEEIELADSVSLDVFGIGEHHRGEYLDSAPAVILAAAASRTKRIRLTSAVTVLSAADPVRSSRSLPPWISFQADGRRSWPGVAPSPRLFRSSDST